MSDTDSVDRNDQTNLLQKDIENSVHRFVVVGYEVTDIRLLRLQEIIIAVVDHSIYIINHF